MARTLFGLLDRVIILMRRDNACSGYKYLEDYMVCNGKSTRAWTYVFLLCLLCLGGSGCGMKVTFKPPFPETVKTDNVAGKPRYSSVLMYASATMDGTPTVINPPFKDRLLEALRQSNVFENVYGDDQAIPETRKVRLALTTTERMDYNNVLGAIKGFVIGASFFVLSPFIPIYADYTTELRLQVEKPDGSQRQYTGYAAGESEHYFFSHGDYYPDLTKQVTDAALRDLSAKLTNDRAWLQR